MSKINIVWHSLSSHQALKKLNSSQNGLSSSEAKKRLLKYGQNILAKKESFSIARVFLKQFSSALVYVLLIAGLISILFKEFIDAYVIWAAVLLNVVVGFFQEYKANQSLERLSQVVKKNSLVWRDGRELLLDSIFLVPGDIISLRSGDRVPADCRILLANNLQLNEATLTGESLPVKKQDKVLPVGTVLAERFNMALMGTLVVEGTGLAVVVNTGLASEVGQISTLLKETKEEQTPLQLKLNSFAKNITKVILVVAILLFIFGLARGYEWKEMFSVSVAVAVSAIPEGLLISLTMILTIGMQRILKKNGLVRQLVSAETLGSTTVICTDKTGTLTEGFMRVTELITTSHHFDFTVQGFKNIAWDKELEKSVKIAWLCNDAHPSNPNESREKWDILGSATEAALLLFAANFGAVNIFKNFKRKQELPFDSRYKFMLTRMSYTDTHDLLLFKGAPEKILSLAKFYYHNGKVLPLTPVVLKKWHERFDSLTRRGLRALAGATAIVAKDYPVISDTENIPDNITLICLWGLSDPLRLEVAETLRHTHAAGIRTVIITGDNKLTAHRIASDLGINIQTDEIITGDELVKLTDKQLEERVVGIKIYARVSPTDKLRIVQAWQARGEVVAMTGDGVNDAPALKVADVGVAVSSGSDIAKETADLILLDNNFNTIVMAVKEGRVIFANIRKVILYLLSNSFAEMTVIVGGLFLGWPLPLLTGQILWINLICDGFPALALTAEPEDDDIMNTKPHDRKHLIAFEQKFLIATVSLMGGLSSFLAFYYIWHADQNLDLARTMAFTTLACGTLVYVFSIKTLEKNIFSSRPFRNKYLNLGVLAGLLLQLAAVYMPFLNKFLNTVPLSFYHWLMIIAASIIGIIFIELIKFIFNIYYKKQRH